MKNKSGPFEHKEVEGFIALADLENVPEGLQMTDASNKVHESQGVTVQINTLTMNIQTLVKNDHAKKRSIVEMVNMEVDEQSSSKRTKTSAQDKDIVVLEEEESINKGS